MQKETWEERFRKEWMETLFLVNYLKIKDFIRTEINKARQEERGKHAQKINQILNKYSKSISVGGLDYVKAFEAMEDYEHELFKESK